MGTGTYFVIMNRLAHENQKVGLACAMAIVTSLVLKGVGVYNEYYMSNLYLQNEDLRPFPPPSINLRALTETSTTTSVPAC